MGDLTAAAQPSLDRVKNIDKLPDLSSQLSEAEQLCTHDARADMIARWLLEKLKSSQEAQSELRAWSTLILAFRLLSPARVAKLVASFDLLRICQSVLQNTASDGGLLDILAQLVNLLLSLCGGPDGAPVKSALSLTGPLAAAFLGAWMQNFYQYMLAVETTSALDDSPALLSPALRMWDLRKRSIDDNELFSTHCLVSGACLLSVPSIGSVQRRLKRKLDHGPVSSRANCREALESLLARHIFLSARTAFFQAHNSAALRNRKDVGSQNPSWVIDSLLRPLKEAVHLQTLNIDQAAAILPLLLEVALRCTPTATLKQRMKETPWVETLFKAMLDCSLDPNGRLMIRPTLTEMLSVIVRRASLSKDTLKDIMDKYANLEASHSGETDWELIARVIELNVDVIVDGGDADRLFAAVSMTISTRVHYSTHNIPLDSDLLHLLRSRIIVPIMRGFGKSRKLPAFVDLWATQLRIVQHHSRTTVWTELDDAFREVLDESLTLDQFMKLFEECSTSLETEVQTADSLPIIWADVLILHALLSGARSEALLDRLEGKIEPLLASILRFVKTSTEDAGNNDGTLEWPWQMWALITKCFELWFPVWASRAAKASIIAERGSSLLQSAAVRSALDVAGRVGRAYHDHPLYVRMASEAECFVASVCHHFDKLDVEEDSAVDCSATVNELVHQLHPCDVQSLLTYPDVLAITDKTLRRNFLEDSMAVAGELDDATDFSASLCAMAAAAVCHAQSAVIQDIAFATLKRLESFSAQRDEKIEVKSSEERVIFEMLLEIPSALVDRATREAILDRICSMPDISQADNEQRLQKRLSVLIHFMDQPNATCSLATNPQSLQGVATSLSPPDTLNARAGCHGNTTTNLLAQLVKLVFKHLLATQEQERSRMMLIALSDLAPWMKSSCSRMEDFVDSRGVLTLITTSTEQLELGVKDDLREQLLHRNFETTSVFVEAMGKKADVLMSDLLNANFATVGRHKTETLRLIMDTLLAIPESLMATVISRMQAMTNISTKLLVAGLRHPSLHAEHGTAVEKDELQDLAAALVCCYQMLCRYSSPTADFNFAAQSTRLFSLNLRPDDHALALEAFAEYLRRLDNTSTAALISELLQDGATISAPALLLIRSCLFQLQQDGMEHAAPLPQILTKLLETASHSDDLTVCRSLASCIFTILESKPFMTNQHNVEQTLAALPKLSYSGPSTRIAFVDACRILSALLLHHRARLQGRFHIVVAVFQGLISRLFNMSKHRHSSARIRELKAKHAHALARLLTLFCEPPQTRRQSHTPQLVDQSRKEQVQIGQHVQHVLHHYCSQILSSTMGEGVREALMPGLWSVIEAIEMHDADGIKSLSAAMNNSERAVLRSVYDDWKRFGKWRGN